MDREPEVVRFSDGSSRGQEADRHARRTRRHLATPPWLLDHRAGRPTTVAGIDPPNFASLRLAAKRGPVAQGRVGRYPRQALRRNEWLTVPGG